MQGYAQRNNASLLRDKFICVYTERDVERDTYLHTYMDTSRKRTERHEHINKTKKMEDMDTERTQKERIPSYASRSSISHTHTHTYDRSYNKDTQECTNTDIHFIAEQSIIFGCMEEELKKSSWQS